MPPSKNKDNLCYPLCCTQTDMEISKLRRENAYLRRALDELSLLKGEPSDSENNKLLLERILSLETIREKNSQQLLVKDEEIASLRKQLYRNGGETVACLQDQIDCYVKEIEQRDRLIQSLQTETEDAKNKLVTASAKCQDLQSRVAGQQNCRSDEQESSSTATVLLSHLRDALEKNQQWLAYDQQREAYVKATVAMVSTLEQQLNQTKQALSQQHNEALSDERKKMALMQEHYEKLLLTARKELDALREKVNTAHTGLNEMQWRCEEKQKEVDDIKQQLQAERLNSRKSAQEERRCSGDREGRLRAEAEDLQARLDQEKHRSAELLLQVKLLQKTMLSQQQDQKTIAILEQQIQLSAKELQDEKQEHLHSQKQLCRVLKELCKTKGHVAKMSEKEQQNSCSYEAGAHSRPSPSKPSRESLVSSPRLSNPLDESFLECPGCSTQYPLSQHRELLAHLDHCLD